MTTTFTIKLQPPLHPEIQLREIPFVLPLAEDLLSGGKLHTEEVAAIAAALNILLAPGEIEAGRYVPTSPSDSDWFSSALVAQCARRL